MGILFLLLVVAWLFIGVKIGYYIHEQAIKENNQDELFKVAYQDGYGDGYNDGKMINK